MRRLFTLSYILALAGLVVTSPSIPAADWPQWRGPDRNGLGPKSPALANSVAGLTPMWVADGIPSGDEGGRGGIVIRAGKVYGLVSAVSKSHATDDVFCLDAANGKIVWKSRLGDSTGNEAGASTPCIVKDRLYVAGSGSTAYCLNADTGSPIWETKFSRTSREPIASSFVVVGGAAVVMADVLTALDTQTGKPLWTQDQITGHQSSPTAWNSKGHDYVICNSAQKTHCVDAADGRIVWSVSGGGTSTPVVSEEYGGDFLVNMTENHKTGLSAYRLTDKDPQRLWTLQESDRGSSPVVFDGHVYAIAGGGNGHNSHLLSIHLDTGKVAWEEMVDFAEVSSPVIADGKVFAVCGTYLSVLAATPEKYSMLSQDDYRITLCTSPTIVEGRLYVRQANAVACYDLRAAP